MPLLKFGDITGKTYDFTSSGKVFLGAYRDNFAQVDSITHKSPGMSGAFDAYGQGVPPTKLGNIRQELEIRATARTSIDTYRDELRAMVSWGKQRLYFRPENTPTQADRMCYAKCTKVEMSIDKNAHNLIQKASIEWEVTDPRWGVAKSSGGLWGSGTWGSSLWGVAPFIMNLNIADGDQTALTYNGTAATPLLIELVTDGTATVSAPVIQRVVDARVVDEVRFNQAMAINQSLLIDSRKHEVRYQYQKVNDTRFVYKRAHWFILESGSQFIRFHCDAYSGTPVLRLWYDEYYR